MAFVEVGVKNESNFTLKDMKIDIPLGKDIHIKDLRPNDTTSFTLSKTVRSVQVQYNVQGGDDYKGKYPYADIPKKAIEGLSGVLIRVYNTHIGVETISIASNLEKIPKDYREDDEIKTLDLIKKY